MRAGPKGWGVPERIRVSSHEKYLTGLRERKEENEETYGRTTEKKGGIQKAVKVNSTPRAVHSMRP